MKCTSLASLMAVVLMAGVGLCGENKTEPPPKVKGHLPTGWKALGLSDEQKEKIFDAQAKYAAQIADLNKQISDLKKKEKAEIVEVLTDAQKARLREIALEKAPADTAPKETSKPANKPASENKTPENKPANENSNESKPPETKLTPEKKTP